MLCLFYPQLLLHSYLVSIREEYEPYTLVEACQSCRKPAFSILKSSWKMSRQVPRNALFTELYYVIYTEPEMVMFIATRTFVFSTVFEYYVD